MTDDPTFDTLPQTLTISKLVPCRVLAFLLAGACLTVSISWSLAAFHSHLSRNQSFDHQFHDEWFSPARWLRPFIYDRNISGVFPPRYAPRVWQVRSIGEWSVFAPGVQRIAAKAIAYREPAGGTPFENQALPPFWSLSQRDPRKLPTPLPSPIVNEHRGGPTPFQAENEAVYIEQATGLPFLSMYGAALIEWNGAPVRKNSWSIPLPWEMRIDPNSSTNRILPLKPIWLGFLLNTLFWSTTVFVACWVWKHAVTDPRVRRRFARGLCVKRRCAYPLNGAQVCPECGTEQLPVLLGRKPSPSPPPQTPNPRSPTTSPP